MAGHCKRFISRSKFGHLNFANHLALVAARRGRAQRKPAEPCPADELAQRADNRISSTVPTPATTSEMDTMTAITCISGRCIGSQSPTSANWSSTAPSASAHAGFLGRPVVERSRLAGGDVADERAQALGEVGLGRSGDVALHRRATLALRTAPRRADGLPSRPMDEPQQIGFTAAESTPRFPHDPKPPAGAPNVVAIVLDDTGFGHLGAFGSDIGTPHLDGLAAGGAPFNRFHVTSLCSPDQGVVLHRAQPPRGRDGLPGRHPAGLPRLRRPAAQDGRHAPPAPARRRVLDAGRRQVAPHPALAALGRRALRHLAARPRVRALLRVPAGRHQPLGPEPRLRQPLHRPAAPARGGLPPQRGPGRPGGPHGAGPAAGGARASPSSCTSPSAPCTRPTTWRPSGSTPTGACSTRGGTPGATSCSPASSPRAWCPRAPC